MYACVGVCMHVCVYARVCVYTCVHVCTVQLLVIYYHYCVQRHYMNQSKQMRRGEDS